jgi:hypothetical protein
MKRIVAFLAAVCISTGICLATALAQTAPPPPPTDAAGDTVKTGTPEATQNTATPAAEADTTAAADARTRRMRTASQDERRYIFSLGIGSGVEYKPDEFKENYSPAFGLLLAFGVRQHGVTVATSFGYNFFLAEGVVPNDLSILTIFLDLRYSPTKSKARPYILVCGGYWRQWVVDLDYTENVLGYGGGAGVEVEIDRTKRLFLDARYIQGQTRTVEPGINIDQANTEIIPIRLGVTWEIQ